MDQTEIKESKTKIVSLLTQRGAMCPSQIAAELWLYPGDTMTLLKSLSEEKLIIMRSDKNSVDGMVVAPTTKARLIGKGDTTF